MLFFYIGMLALVIQGYLSQKASPKVKKVSIIGLLIFAISIIFLGKSTTIPLLLICLVFMSLGISLINTYVPSLLTLNSSSNVGSTMGIFESLNSLSRIFGPLIVYTTFFTKLPLLYTACGILLGVSTLIFIIISTIKPNLIKG